MKITKNKIKRLIQERVSDFESFEIELADSGTMQVEVPWYIILDALEDGLGPDGLLVEIEEFIENEYDIQEFFKLSPQSEAAAKTMHAEYQAGGVLSDEEIFQRGFTEGKKMKVTKRQLRRIIKEEKRKLLREYGNSPPPRDSNWRGFADAFDIGVLDLDEIAYDLGFQDFNDMDISISPKALASRDSESFATAVGNNSMAALDMSTKEILNIAMTPSHLLDRDSLVKARGF